MVHLGSFQRGFFSCKNPLFVNPKLGVTNLPPKAPEREGSALCGVRQGRCPLETHNFLKKIE